MSKKEKHTSKEEETVETTVDTEETPKEEKEETKTISKEEDLENQLKEQKEKYLRLYAEYENYRKRTQNEKLGIYDDATAKAVTEILPVADSIQMAIQNSEGAPEEFLKGLELVNNQIASSMEKLKVESFGEIGDEFNPEIHNAVSKIENADLGENQLAMVFQKGFKIGDKVIRHAMVQVANCD